MDQKAYRKLISGRSTGLLAAVLRFLLAAAAVLYLVIISLRNLLYSISLLKTHRVDATVISVGNITTGGTGKTPLVIWLCKEITQNSKLKTQNCAILTRGYKTTQNLKLKTQNYTDEPLILKQSCPQTEIIVNPNRVAGAKQAIKKYNTKVLIADDGFQHRRLARDLDIVTIDATCPFGYGRILPAGLLREPLCSLKRANAIVITRTDQVSESQLKVIENKLLSINPDLTIAKATHAPVAIETQEKSIGLEELKGKKVFAFCGIGNPDAFLVTIENIGAELIGSQVYNDHYHYTEADIDQICRQASDLKADIILTTQKDWTKIHPLTPTQKDIDLGYLAIEIKFAAGEENLRQLIEKAFAGKILGN